MDYKYRITTFKDNRVLNTKEIKTKDEAKEEVSTLKMKGKNKNVWIRTRTKETGEP